MIAIPQRSSFWRGGKGYAALTALVVWHFASTASGAVIAHWQFNEKSPGASASSASGAILDSSGNGRHLTASGNPLPVYTAGATHFGATAALKFTAGTDQLSLTETTAFNFNRTDSFTLEVVVKIASNAVFTGNIIGRDWGADLPSWWFRVEAGVPRFLISQEGGPQPNVASSVSIDDDGWHHVAATRDATSRKLRIYVDGVLTGEANDTTTQPITNAQKLVVGAFNNGGRQFEGEMDFVRASSGALQPAEFLLGNLAILNLEPRDGVSFVPENSEIQFTVLSDFGVDASGIQLFLNGTNRSGELVVSGPETKREVKFGGLKPEMNYSAVISITDKRGNKIQRTRQFDTYTGHVTPVFWRGENGYHTFRIPSILALPNGTLLAICEARKNSGSDAGDIDLVQKKSSDFGKTWSDLQLIWSDGENTIGNPCPVRDETTGTIWLPFCRNNSRVFMTSSTNEGTSWSAPVEITSSVKATNWSWYATGPGVGIQMKNGPHKGRMIIPSDHSAAGRGSEAHTFHSDDHGATWQLGGTIAPKMNECQLVELTDGRLMMNLRNGDALEEARAVSFSSDGGMTWSAIVRDPVLIEPICQASIQRYTTAKDFDRNRILFSNPASVSARTNLTVRLSYDEGKSWPVKEVLHAGPTAYSCLTILPDDTIGCLYEAGTSNSYETITFARFSLAWLSDGADRPVRRRVNLERTDAGVSIRWPEAFSNSVVEFCEQLGDSTRWFELGKRPELIDGFWTYLSPMQSSQRFYRLKIPDAISN